MTQASGTLPAVTDLPHRSSRHTTTTSISLRRAASNSFSRNCLCVTPEPTSLTCRAIVQPGRTGATTHRATLHGQRLLIQSGDSGIQADAGCFPTDLDTLASSIIQQVNKCHVQGIGTDGSFTKLNGQTMPSDSISDYVPPVSDGSFFIRVTYTDPNTKQVTVTRQQINVSTTESLGDIANAISNVPGLNATAYNNKLNIQADANYKFDFLPAVQSEPTRCCYTANNYPSVSVSGVYTGTENQTFTCIATGSGSVGNGTLNLEVEDGDGKVVDTFNIGSGYAAGDELDLGNGIEISVGSGDLNAGDNFAVDAYANTDTSGLLATVGLNTFFTGSSATDIAVSSDLADNAGQGGFGIRGRRDGQQQCAETGFAKRPEN